MKKITYSVTFLAIFIAVFAMTGAQSTVQAQSYPAYSYDPAYYGSASYSYPQHQDYSSYSYGYPYDSSYYQNYYPYYSQSYPYYYYQYPQYPYPQGYNYPYPYYPYYPDYHHKPEQLRVVCRANTSVGYLGQPIVWTAYPTGGTGKYTYEWDGERVDGDEDDSQSIFVTYTKTGTKAPTVEVRSGSRRAKEDCEPINIIRYPSYPSYPWWQY